MTNNVRIPGETVRDFAKLICKTHRREGKPFTKELYDELARELQAYFPKMDMRGALANIRIFDPKTKSKKMQLNKTKRKRRRGEPSQYAYSCIPLYNNGDVGWKTVLAVELQHQFPKLKFLTAKSIVDKAYFDYEKAKANESEPPPRPEVVDKKEVDLSTSVKTQVESHEEIESRLYSFALNFLFSFQDSGKSVLRTELIKAINDYIEHYSLTYTEVQRLANDAISEFREKSKTIPEFKTD